MSVPNMEFFQMKIFVLLDKIRKSYKVFKNLWHWLLQHGCSLVKK